MKSVIAIFDVGKTNKKILLFDKQFNIVYERSLVMEETTDEDGDPCENLELLKTSLFDSLNEIIRQNSFDIQRINYTAYGASFVYVDKKGKELTPLYNYLKQYPADLQRKFYDKYGGEEKFSHATASPVLGSLNSGLQLYRLKYEQPAIFEKLHAALHLPQYLAFLFTGKQFSDMTSIGSHTALWDFTTNNYHEWVDKEGIKDKLPPIQSHSDFLHITYKQKELTSGIGLHDSSAALIPYLVNFPEPFALISSGTWNITLSPFNHTPLTTAELEQDCLCYFSYWGKPVKASRLFAGYEHAEQVKKLSSLFNKDPRYYEQVKYDSSLATQDSKGLSQYTNYEAAYHQVISDLVNKQVISSNLVLTTDVKHIFVDGGFSKNPLFMQMLATMYPDKKVYAASIAQSTALGAALAVQNGWSDLPAPQNLVGLKLYAPGLEVKHS